MVRQHMWSSAAPLLFSNRCFKQFMMVALNSIMDAICCGFLDAQLSSNANRLHYWGGRPPHVVISTSSVSTEKCNKKNKKITRYTTTPVFLYIFYVQTKMLIIYRWPVLRQKRMNDQKCNPSGDAFSSSSWIKLPVALSSSWQGLYFLTWPIDK